MKPRQSVLWVLAVGLTCWTADVPLAQQSAAGQVTKEQFERWKTELSNWGRWGKDDQMGALNLITPAKRKQAAALVRDGVPISLARDANEEKAVDNPTPYERTVFGLGPAGVQDRFSVSFHGLAHTHMDALAHRFFDGKMYNGIPADEVTEAKGAPRASIHVARNGIFTRGVLIDIPALKGVPYLEPATRITTADLEAWERKAGVKVGAGDALFLYIGRWVRRDRVGPWNTAEMAGFDASVIPWLKARDIAVLATEGAVDARPAPAGSEVSNLAVHDFVQIVMGVHVFDNCDLTALSEAAQTRRRWEFLLTAAPLRFRYGTGSPLNPIAMF
jgi:kynurenine formamidase